MRESMDTLTREGLLGGVRVLDLTRFLAGPYATMIFADMGASVIKIEDAEGDGTRVLPPHFVNGDSAYFLSVNRSKHSVQLDLRSEDGQDLLRRLVAESDVVIDNLRAEKRTELGLSHDHLAAINPMIVSCSLTGFGSDGPYSDRPAYDIVVQALSGVMSLTGERGGRPVRAGVPIGDLVAGLYAVIGVLGALNERATSKRGQHIDVAMLDCQVSLLSYLASYFFAGGEAPGPQGRSHDSIPTYDTFQCADGADVVVAANTERMWQQLCGVLDRPDLTDDERYRTNADRLRNRGTLTVELASAFLCDSAASWADRLNAADVPCARVQNVEEALSDPQVRHREMVWSVPHRDGLTFDCVGSPIKASRSRPSSPFSAPGLGQDTEMVQRLLATYGDVVGAASDPTSTTPKGQNDE